MESYVKVALVGLFAFISLNLKANFMCIEMAKQELNRCIASRSANSETSSGADCELEYAARKTRCELEDNNSPTDNERSADNCNPNFEDCSSTTPAPPRTTPRGNPADYDSCMQMYNNNTYCSDNYLEIGTGLDPDEVFNPSRSDNQASPEPQGGGGGHNPSPSSSEQPSSSPSPGNTTGGTNRQPAPNNREANQPRVPTPSNIPSPNPQPPPPRHPNLNQSVINSKFASCFNKESAAAECCHSKNTASCVKALPEGQALLSQLTQQASGLQTVQGMKNQCNAVKNLQKANLTFTVLAREQCQKKKQDCSSDCNQAYYSVSHIYQMECSGGFEYHESCRELQRGLQEAKESEQICQSMSADGNFMSSITQDLSKIKLAQECEDALQAQSEDGLITAAAPLPGSFDSTSGKPDCSVDANRNHPTCIGEIFKKNQNLGIGGGLNPSGEGQPSFGSDDVASDSNSPPGFDPVTGQVIQGFDERQNQQYLARLDNFDKQKRKLDSSLAQGSSGSGGGGGLLPSSGSSDFKPLPGAPRVQPHKSSLFKDAQSQKGWSSAKGKWNSSRQLANAKLDDDGLSFNDIFSKFKSNEKKPRNLHKNKSFSLSSLFDSQLGQQDIEIGKDQWLFGVNAQLQYQTFTEGESQLNLPPKTLNRKKPSSEFPGLSYLSENWEAAKRYHCSQKRNLNKENILDVQLRSKSLERRVESVNGWLVYNFNRDQNCFNRQKVQTGINTNQFGRSLPFQVYQKEDYFDHSFLKLNYHKGFRDDEKKPLWFFSNNTDEMFFTMLVKKVDPKIDNLKTYRMYLDNFIYYKLNDESQKRSQPIQVIHQKIKNHEWVDGLHYASEAEGYYTRYLATVYKDRALLITFNIKKEALKKYIHPMNQMIASFRLDSNFTPTDYQDEDLQMAFLGITSKSITLGEAKKFPGEIKKSYLQFKKRKRLMSRMTSLLLGLICLGLAGLGYYLLNRKKRNQEHSASLMTLHPTSSQRKKISS